MPSSTTTTPRPQSAYVILIIITLAAGAGPLAIRQTQTNGVPSLYTIAARFLLTTILLAPYIFYHSSHYKQPLSLLTKREWVLLFFAGLLFAVNLVGLFFSLEYTSVLVTGMVRRTSPFWLIWLEMIFLGAMFSRSVWVGLGLTTLGSIFVALGSSSAIGAGSRPMLGMGISLIGALGMAVYLLIGRSVRYRMPALLYSWLVFAFAGVITWVAVFALGVPVVGYTPAGYLWIIIVTIITQFLGHIPINFSLRHFSATHMSIIMQAGVVLSAILAFFFFNEVPSVTQIIGSGAILLGVGLIVWR